MVGEEGSAAIHVRARVVVEQTGVLREGVIRRRRGRREGVGVGGGRGGGQMEVPRRRGGVHEVLGVTVLLLLLHLLLELWMLRGVLT